MEFCGLPLVSVPVVTYNSSKTVLETLDSIYNQTYPNIELIVSDDCSTDNTVEICREWIDKHKERFVRTELLTVEKNTGVSANCNRSGAACRGEWSKGIAGDDIMLPNCIQDCMDYVKEHPEVEFLFSKVEAFGPNKVIVEMYNNDKVFDYALFTLPSKKQWEKFVYEDSHIPAPSLFCKKGAMNKYGVKNDERIPFTEDEPKWINLLKAGAHLDFIDKVTVKYRVGHESALSSSMNATPPEKFNSILTFFIYYKFEERYKKNPQNALESLLKFLEPFYYKAYYFDGSGYKKRPAYKVGRFIMYPINAIKRLFLK